MSLSMHSVDVLTLVGAEVYDILSPHFLMALVGTCSELRHALAALATALRRERGTVQALLLKCGSDWATIQARPVGIVWNSKQIADADALALSLLARSSGSLANLEELDLGRGGRHLQVREGLPALLAHFAAQGGEPATGEAD